MKTLKKTLCLVLAVVMAVGVLVIPANAATPFVDDADITHDEAVAVLNGLGILGGDDKGNYNPDETLNRAQAAKIIAYLVQTPDGAEDYVASSTPFTDVAGTNYEWASNYIAYCADSGIIGGNGDGTFNPGGELTGHAFAKMLLCALGYDGNNEGFGGSNWTSKVETEARLQKLHSGISSFRYADPLSRDDAAQMAYNAMKVQKVAGYNGGTEITLPGGVSITQGAERIQDATTGSLEDDYDLVTLDTADDMLDAEDEFGRPNKYQIAVDGADEALYTQNISSIYNYSSKKTNLNTGDLKNYTGTATDGKVELYVNGEPQADIAVADIQGKTGNGTVVEVYGSKSDKEVDRVVVIETTLHTVTSKSSSKVGLSGSISAQKSDGDNKAWFDVLNGYKKGDYVAVVETSGHVILGVSDVEIVTSTLTARGSKASGADHYSTYTIDGTKYSVHASAPKNWTMGTGEPAPNATQEITAIICGGYIIDIVNAPEAENKAVDSMLVVQTYETAGEWGPVKMFQGILPDGTEIVGAVDTTVGNDITVNSGTAQACTYEYDPDTDLYAFKTPNVNVGSSVKDAGIYKINSTTEIKTSDVRLKNTNLYFDDEVKFIKPTGQLGTLKIDVKTGLQGIKLAAGDYVVVTLDGNNNPVVSAIYVIAGNYDEPEVDGTDLLYINDTDSTGSGLADDGKTAVDIFNGYLNGEEVEFFLKSGGSIDSEGWYSYTVNEETGIYTLKSASDKAKNDVTPDITLVGGVYYLNNDDIEDYDATDAMVVDLTKDGGIESVADLTTLLTTNTGVKVAFNYTSKDKVVNVIYVLNHGTEVEG